MMKILIVDVNIDPDSWGASDLRGFCNHVRGATTYVRRAPQEDLSLDPQEFDRILISGSKTSALEESPWVSHLDNFIRLILQKGKPLLCICYGHQALVRVLGGKQSIRKAVTPEWGWTKIQTISSSILFADLPCEFYSFSAHFEEAAFLPPQVRHLARSRDCEIQAIQLENCPVFGIQFHPEKSLCEVNKILVKQKKIKTHLLEPEKGSSLFDQKIGKTLFENFFKL